MAEISIKIKDTPWFQQLCPVSFSEEQFLYYIYFSGKKSVFILKEGLKSYINNNNNNNSNIFLIINQTLLGTLNLTCMWQKVRNSAAPQLFSLEHFLEKFQ